MKIYQLLSVPEMHLSKSFICVIRWPSGTIQHLVYLFTQSLLQFWLKSQLVQAEKYHGRGSLETSEKELEALGSQEIVVQVYKRNTAFKLIITSKT